MPESEGSSPAKGVESCGLAVRMVPAESRRLGDCELVLYASPLGKISRGTRGVTDSSLGSDRFCSLFCSRAYGVVSWANVDERDRVPMIGCNPISGPNERVRTMAKAVFPAEEGKQSIWRTVEGLAFYASGRIIKRIKLPPDTIVMIELRERSVFDPMGSKEHRDLRELVVQMSLSEEARRAWLPWWSLPLAYAAGIFWHMFLS